MAKKKVTLSHNLMGCSRKNWKRLLKDNPITPEHASQVALMNFVTALLAIPSAWEHRTYDKKIWATSINKGPVYIVGYWRSGTTFLQNLMTRDPQFAWFDPVSTVTFNNCIMLGPFIAKVINKFLKGARPMDNLEYTQDLPMEEVFAQATISTQAISHMLVFPDGGNGTKYIETAFIDEQGEDKQKEWREAYDYILKKITFIKGDKPLLLKSPENTCRIGELKRCYPKAKFINIYRNPYKVIVSTINMFNKEMDFLCLNKPAPNEVIEDVAIDLFARIYKKAFVELDAMSAEDHIDIKYEDFCKAPMEYLEKIYTDLQIEGFEEAKPYLQAHLDSQKNYKKNQFDLDPRIRDKVNEKLGFYFERYGYEMITD